MKKTEPSVFTIAPGIQFLETLADKILEGFPLPENAVRPSLSAWTILLPTRRAARELSEILAAKVAPKAILLPQIKPIGDLDEDHILSQSNEGDLPPAISRSGQLLTVMNLLDQWARENLHINLAQEIRHSPSQTLNLAVSLIQLLDQVEIEEVNFDKLSDAYDADLSEHRNSILSLINLLKIDLPSQLHRENLMSPVARRSKLIRLEAQRIENDEMHGPLIAAGSTGTIPATRALLKAISRYQNGAVILPGLDQIMDDEAWSAISPDHPQFALKTLIDELNVTRSAIHRLEPEPTARNWLGSELMRPTATAEQWHKTLKGQSKKVENALIGLNLIESSDRHKEARAIALILRETLEHPVRKAALITPDRDLAKRVKNELLRWSVSIDDSAGEPLANFGLASLCLSLIAMINDGISSSSLLRLLSHADCSLGLERVDYLKRLRNLEIVVLRGYGNSLGLSGLKNSYDRAVETRRLKQRCHPLVAQLTDEDWSNLHQFILLIIASLRPIEQKKLEPLSTNFNILDDCIRNLAPDAIWTDAANLKLAEILFDLKSQSHRYAIVSLQSAGFILSHLLRSEPFRTMAPRHPQLAIYGVLEARLISADVIILGGLNEGKWPAQPDPGPWLNRTMRTIFGLQQPERDIGLSAHDFAQSFGSHHLYLTYAKRIEGAPQIASRWILRLQTVLQVAETTREKYMDQTWSTLAERIDQPETIEPIKKPKPTPPIAARPVEFSVSAVERLIRDPYALYASKILRLEKLPDFEKSADAPLRGTLFHSAIDDWNKQQPEALAEDSLALLMNFGKKVFEPLQDDLDVSFFWWPRFRRMATWLTTSEELRRQNCNRIHAEIDGRIDFKISDVDYVLKARADRIDILVNGRARIIDYKSGTLPTAKQIKSGMKPQLPLEAAILAQGGFSPISKMTSEELLFLQIGGSGDEGKELPIKADERTLDELALAHFAAFKSLLHAYRKTSQAYYPRANMFKEEEASDFDHLSRYAEWILAGEE